MNHIARFAAVLALIIGAAGIAGIRAQAPRDSQGSPAVTFQVEVDYVDVDVVVTDEQGNFVKGLTRDDFEVHEDGKPLKVDTLSASKLIAESGREVSVARDELSGVAAGRDKSATYGLSRTIPLREVPPGSYLLRVEAQRRGDADAVVVRETRLSVVPE